MNRFLLILVCSSAVFSACGQSPQDTLSLWNYNLQAHAKTTKDRSIGQIVFWRTKPIADSVYVSRHQEAWTPQISFSVYPLADSVYCEDQSRRFKMSSSCMGPDVGGDIYRVGNFILLNRDICLSCVGYTSKKDYCRPSLNQLINAIDKRKVKTLADLEAQMVVKKGVPK
jgi:hypothetical protein